MNEGLYRYYLSSKRDYCLYATYEGLLLENALNILDRNSTEYNKTLNFILDCQNQQDGYFYCPGCKKDGVDDRLRCTDTNRDIITYKSILTLLTFNVFPKYPIPEGGKFNGNLREAVRETFLSTNPYAAGSLVGNTIGLYALKLLLGKSDPRNNPYIREIIDLLFEFQDLESGFWFPRDDLLNGMNGLLKMRSKTFDACGIKIPHQETIIKSILSIQKSDGSFGSECADWNAAGLLAEIGRNFPSYRQKIVTCYEKLLPVMRKKQDCESGGFRWGTDPSEEVSLKATSINVGGIRSMKCFLKNDNNGLDEIFVLRKLRKLWGMSIDNEK